MSASSGIFSVSGPGAGKRQVLVAGGGIAGLTAALALEQRGFAVTVYERAPQLSAEGAGLQLSPNATRLLAKLGVLNRLEESAVKLQSVGLMSAAGKPLLTLDVTNSAARWGAPYLAVHRASLAAALMQEIRQKPAISVRFSAEVTHFASHANGVTASVTASQGIGEAAGVFLVGADGARSRISGELSNPSPHFTGWLAHRAMADASAALPEPLRLLLERRSVGAFLAPGAHLVAYPLSGGAQMNLVCVTRMDAEPLLREAPLPPHAAARFSPELAEFLKSCAWTHWPVWAQRGTAKWTDGRSVSLIGDAAHAAAPFAAQGAAMAIEDAWTLAFCLQARRENLPQAVQDYETLRRARIKRVAARTALNGFAYHSSGPIAMARNAVFAVRGQKMLDGLDWLYGFDAGAAADLHNSAAAKLQAALLG